MWTGVLVLSLVAAAPFAGSVSQPTAADCATWQECRDAVESALGDEAVERALDLAWRAVQKGPKDDPALMFLLARAQSRAGRPQDALVMVRRLAERGIRTEALDHADLERMRELAGWAALEPLVARANSAPEIVPAPTPPAARAAGKGAAPRLRSGEPAPESGNAPPKASTSTARAPRSTIESGTATEDVLRFSADRFTPSGLAYDAVSRRFVMGDELGRKLRVVGEGLDHAVDLVRADSAGFLDIRSLAIDTRRGDLWVATSDTSGAAGTLHRIQLVSGRPLQSFPLPAEEGRSILPVDLAVAESGAVFVLHRDGRIQRARPGTPGIETVATPKLEGATSLTLTQGDGAAYVAHAGGLLRLDLGSRAASPVTAAAELPLTGIERLRMHRAGLVALQRGPDGERRLLRFELSRNGRSIRAATAYDVRVEVGSSTAFTVSGDEVAIVTGGTGADEAIASSPAVGPPAELVVRRFRLR